MLEKVPASRAFWAAVLAFRAWNALFVRTSFNPDEYWQGPEVAHRLAFGYGHLTWEWQEDARIRGFAHPAVFALLFKILELCHLDTRWAIAYGPRLFQAVVSTLNDYFLYKLARTYFDSKSAKWALVCTLFSWFLFYVMVRPFSNTLETLFTTAALSYWPWKFQDQAAVTKRTDGDTSPILHNQSNRTLALALAALGVLFRPTNVVVWIYPGIMLLLHATDKVRLVCSTVLPIAVATIGAMLVIDRVGYGEWTFVPYNFIKFNVLEGKDKLYGEHPWNWYFAQGFPSIVGTALPLAIAGYLTVPPAKKELGYTVLWSLFIYSNAPHKEFRFVLPLLPPTLVYAGYCLRNLENRLYVQMRERTQRNLFLLSIFTVIVPNVGAAYYLSRVHQRAPADVMDFLADRIQVNSSASIHFWTPCHATPYYSYLHQNVSMWFPDCSPVNRERDGGCESHQLEQNPIAFLMKTYSFTEVSSEDNNGSPRMDLPTYVVVYSTIAPKISGLLRRGRYVEEASFAHSETSGDADSSEFAARMLVYKRQQIVASDHEA